VTESARADKDIYSLIAYGRLEEARQALSEYATAAVRDGDILFYQSLLEPDAAAAAQLMEASLKASVSPRYQEEIHYRLAQYYFLAKDYDKLGRVLLDYYSLWETGKYHAEMLRLSALLDESQGQFEAALKQSDRYLVTYTSDDCQQLGQIDKARIMKANHKSIGSLKTLRSLARQRDGVAIPEALYLLGVEAAEKNRVDDAVFYYNLLREGYPSAVGLDHLAELMGGLSAPPTDNTAEKITGTYYTVKVGVFSVKDNAEKQADNFRRYDRKIEIKDKTISGKKYHVVYVGRFQDYQSALAFKEQLEATHGEPFQVVTR
jgi:tetratricopeptide (TPR) repeat protein